MIVLLNELINFYKMRKKVKVLTVSKVFMKDHPKVGMPTLFKDKILMMIARTIGIDYTDIASALGLELHEKIHTIRETSDWPKIAKKISNGEMILSVRQWEGIPYQSKQDKPIMQLSDIGIQKITIANRVSEYKCYVDGLLTDINTIANNDGLSKQDFIDWFKPYFGKGEMLWNGVIIHFTPFRYNSES